MHHVTKAMDPKHQELRLTRTVVLDKGNAEDKRQEILDYYNKTYTMYEELFKVITNKRSFYTKPEPLRHPLVFYFGHTAVFLINKLILAGLIQERINPKFESMFAVGVDEMDWDDLNDSHYEWPTMEELMRYRSEVRNFANKLIKEMPICVPITWSQPFWLIMMAIEHERIHLETSAVIIRRLAIDEVHDEPLLAPCPDIQYSGYDDEGVPRVDQSEFPKNELLPVEGGHVHLTKKDGLYGWDNEYGDHKADIGPFKASKYLVSNYEYLEFIQDGGYDKEQYWTEEGWRWNRSTKMKRPLFWIPDTADIDGKQTYKYRTLTRIIDMPWDWPVETNYLESKAFCNWKAEKTGKPIRLPTEDEWYVLRNMIPSDQTNWEFGTVGNINMEVYASSCPINRFETNGFYDIIGNVWQHTETPIDGFDGFKVHPYYDDFSTPTFDTKHNMIKGGSWITTGNEAIYASRYAFRRHFYQFAGLRYVETNAPVIINCQSYEMDPVVSQSLESHYSSRKYFNVENFPKRCAELCIEACKEFNVPLTRALELGCAVGRTTFELAKGGFEEANGIDLSARFFHLAAKLKELGKIRYGLQEEGDIVEFKEIELSKLGFDDVKEKTQFYQQDASNLDFKKFNSFDLVFAGNLICRMRQPKKMLQSIHNLVKPGGLLILTSTCSWDTEYTDKDQWVGGYKKDAENYSTHTALKDLLKEEFNEVKNSHEIELVIRKTKREFNYSFAKVFYFQRKVEK